MDQKNLVKMKKIEVISGLESRSYTVYRINPPMEITKFGKFLGIDPGSVNLGIAEIISMDDVSVRVFQIKLERFDNPVDRMINLKNLLKSLFIKSDIVSSMCIEGAGYQASKYRQVELEQVRTVCALWGIENRYVPVIVPPNSIRKQVFGTAKFLPHKEWTEI